MQLILLVPALGLLSVLAGQARHDLQAAAPESARGPTSSPTQQGDGPTGGTAAARAAQSLTDPHEVLPIHTLDPDPDGEYGIWAAGAKYKASFHGDMTFVPYLGSDYPHNQPLSWRTTSVRAGAEELLAAGELPARHREPLRYSYRYQRFTEVYDVLAEGLEQSFVIHAATGHGDLVIEGRLTTALRGEPIRDQHRAIRFSDEQQRLITTYGKAWAFDARGRKTEVTSTLADDRIRLTVDGGWLADAAFPVVVDPILTPVRMTFGSLRESADVCRDDSGDDRMLVYVRSASATDKDAIAQIHTDNFLQPGVVFADITTNWSHDQIRVAATHLPQKYVAVFDRTIGTDSRIRFHVHDSGDRTLSSTVWNLPFVSGTWDWRADVGGTVMNSTTGDVLIAYQHEPAPGNSPNSEILGVVVDVAGAVPVIGTGFSISGPAASLDRERPSVSKRAAGTDPAEWMTVFQVFDNSVAGDDWDAIGRLVDSNDTVSSSVWRPKNMSTGGFHQLGPVVAGTAGRYCVAYAPCDQTIHSGKTQRINGTAIATERVEWTDISGLPTKFDEHLLRGPNGDRRWVVGDIGYDNSTDSHWALLVLSDDLAGGTGNVYIHRVGFNGADLEDETLYNAPQGYRGDLGGVAFDDDNKEWAAVWLQNDIAAPTVGSTGHWIYGNSYSYDPVALPTVSGSSCSNATIYWWPIATGSGSAQQIGHEFTGVRVTGTPANSLHFIGASLQPANNLVPIVPVANGCRELISTTNGWLGWFPMDIGSVGSADFPLPEWLPSMTLHFQDWYIDPATLMVYSTQRLTVPLVK